MRYFFILHSSFFILHFSFQWLLILFFGSARRKEPKEEPPTAFFPLRMALVFLKRENSQAALAQTARAF